MAQYYRISIIGSGNVAWHLARHLENAGHQVCEVWSRNIDNAGRLADKLYEAIPTDSLDLSESSAEVFIISVPDDLIEEISASLLLPENSILAHTSGSKSIDTLLHEDSHHGVFYPLQTFSKAKEVSFREIPILIEASSEGVEEVLLHIAGSISKQVHYASSEQRLSLHLAAVFACNFTNHLFSIAKNILETEDLTFNLLKPLISETVEKAFKLGPEQSQTGPAARKDLDIIYKHLDTLKGNTELQQLYRLFSESIMERKLK